MDSSSDASVRVIGQIALMQSVVASLPDMDSILSFICQGLQDVPGVLEVDFFKHGLNSPEAIWESDVRQFAISHRNHIYADLGFRLSDEAAFEIYQPYIENFCVVLGLIFEEQQQRKEKEQLLATLEKRVKKRTKSLELEIQERKLAQKELLQSEENLHITLDSIGDGVISTDNFGIVTRINPVAERLTGWTKADAYGVPLSKVFHIVHSTTREPVPSPVEQALATGEITQLANNTVLINRDGTERHIADSGAPIRYQNGEIRGVVLVFRDVTEEYSLQNQLRQSQKMEALGQLSGGIAHDFNNQLVGVLGYAESLIEQLNNETLLGYAKGIKKGAQQSAELTAQLLAFSRRGKYLSEPVDIHEAIADVVSILNHSIDKRIRVKQILSPESVVVLGDPVQLQNMILNVALNARDAMPEGGELSFITEITTLSPAYCEAHHYDIMPGSYVHILVKDSGCGMDQETLRFIFEPFFTTKGIGKGSGMGLASVYGTVKNHLGVVEVKSELDHGSTFEFYLPLHHEVKIVQQERDEKPTKSGAHILLADDEPAVRDVTEMMLESLGHTVTSCCDGRETIDTYRKIWKEIDIVILDMIMPEINGGDAARVLREINPEVRIALSSGYSLNEEAQQILDEGAQAFIGKPFTMSELVDMLEKVL